MSNLADVYIDTSYSSDEFSLVVADGTVSGNNSLKVVKMPTYIKVDLIALDSGAQYNYYCVRVGDARTDYQTYGAGTGYRYTIGEATYIDFPGDKKIQCTTAMPTYIAVCDGGKVYTGDISIYVFAYDVTTNTKAALFWPSDK